MKMMTPRGLMFALVMAALVCAQVALAQGYSITGTTQQTIDFATFDGSGLDSAPLMGQLDSDHWRFEGFSDGDTTFGATGLAGTDYSRGITAGDVTSGGLYALDTGGGDIAMGVQATGSDFAPGVITLRITNNTGGDMTSLDLSYDFVVYNNENRSSSLTFSHSSDDMNWTDVMALDEATPEAADGMPMWNGTTKSTTINFASPLADGSHYYLRWSTDDVSGSGSRDEFGLDNIVLTASAASATPAITSISPTSGSTAGGTTVTITGTDLSGVNAVTFGGTAATNVSVVNDTTITCDTPAGSAGMVDVVVSDGTNMDTLMNGYTFVVPTPDITSIAPMSGTESGGTAVTITGTELSGVTSVTFDGTAATDISVVDDTTITCTTPAGSGTVDVAVSDGTNGDTLAGGYMYTTPTPVISSISPMTGTESGGTTVTITGIDLSGVTSVTFDGTESTNVSVVDATTITCTTPAGTGTVDVVISDGTDMDTLAGAYTYTAPAPALVSISPAMGGVSGGTSVTLTGTDLDLVTSVTIGGTAATNLNIVDATTLTCDTPAGMLGAVDVVASDGTATSTLSGGFTYTVAPLSITAISPNGGYTAGGLTVTITGTSLSGVSEVLFGTTQGTNIVIVSDTEITVDTPAGTGTVDVTVNDGVDSDTLTGGFTYYVLNQNHSCAAVVDGGSSTLWLLLSLAGLTLAALAAPRRRKA